MHLAMIPVIGNALPVWLWKSLLAVCVYFHFMLPVLQVVVITSLFGNELRLQWWEASNGVSHP